jgi:hypothetical protein
MGKPKLLDEKIRELINLRKTGHSIPEIHRLLKISKSTALRYSQGVEILADYKDRWLDRRNASKIISEKAWKIAEKSSSDLINEISDRDLILIGAALYWAEGAKSQFNFINSDPEMIRLFMYILLEVYKIPREMIKISIRLFEDVSIPKALIFWANVTKIELNDKTEINLVKGSKQGKLPFGMCRIRVKKGGLLLKRFFAINKRVVSIISLITENVII